MRVLALQLKRIGDLVLTLPALRALREAGAHVTVAVTAGAAGLLPALSGSINDAMIYHPGRANLPVWNRLPRGGWDACVDFTGRDRSALMTAASRARRRVISGDALRQKAGWRRRCYNAVATANVRGRHTVDYYLDHLAPLGIAPSSPSSPTLQIPPAAEADARAILAAHGLRAGEFAVIHPGSARPEKYWPPERWAEVIGHCQRTLGLRCVLTGGRGDPYEDGHLAAIRAVLKTPAVDMAGKLDLLGLTAVLARARLFAGVDSGPMHLAAACGLPQVVLFGPTNPFHWRPRGRDCLVLQSGRDRPLAAGDFQQHSAGGPVDRISTAAVIDCINQLAGAPEALPSAA